MMFRTHIAIGFLAGLFLIQAWNPANQLLFMFLVLLGSALPDIDHPDSKIGSKVKVIGFLFEHRGFFHSLFAALLVFLVLVYYSAGMHYGIYIYGLTVGYILHILSDSITKEGIMPFHPISKFRLNGFIRTGRGTEYIILVAVVVLSLWKLFTLT
jgi:inner membrane protein